MVMMAHYADDDGVDNDCVDRYYDDDDDADADCDDDDDNDDVD